MSSPIPYTTDIERIDQDEADVNAELADTFRQIIETTYRDLGHGFRGVHAKSHALLQARVRAWQPGSSSTSMLVGSPSLPRALTADPTTRCHH